MTFPLPSSSTVAKIITAVFSGNSILTDASSVKLNGVADAFISPEVCSNLSPSSSHPYTEYFTFRFSGMALVTALIPIGISATEPPLKVSKKLAPATTYKSL